MKCKNNSNYDLDPTFKSQINRYRERKKERERKREREREQWRRRKFWTKTPRNRDGPY